MNRDEVLRKLTDEYISTRPFLDIKRPAFGIFFLATAGSGKSTLRDELVKKLHVTYICNDEVKLILNSSPDAKDNAVTFKEVMVSSWQEIMNSYANKTVIFDTSILTHHNHPDSYINMLRKKGIPTFVINLNLDKEELVNRIRTRGRDVEHTLEYLNDQLADYDQTLSEILPSWSKAGKVKQADIKSLVDQIVDFTATL